MTFRILKFSPLKINKYHIVCLIISVFLFSCSTHSESEKPNVVLILADDMGFGDIAINQPSPKVVTPVLDQLTKNGISFSNAHAASAVCTPSRFSLLTGLYPWRSKLKSGVLFGYDLPLIEENQATLGDLFQSHGYQTACIGKWHLGLPWRLNASSDYLERTSDSIYYQVLAKPEDVDHLSPFTDQQWYQKVGFDYFYGISASLDIPPFGIIENGGFIDPLDSELTASPRSVEYNRGFWREGLATEDFDPSEVFPDLIEKSRDFISRQKEPFFLYLPLTAPHTPWLPDEKFKGSSQAGKYGDFISMVDWSVGEVIKTLKQSNKLENTIIVFTSDNGAPIKGIEEFGGNGHQPNAAYRGQKGDLYEGGHRIPLIVSWPGKLQEGFKTSSLVSLTDFFETFREVLGDTNYIGQSNDSYSFYGLLIGDESFQGRQETVYHSQIGKFAIQSDAWKYIDILGSGGFTKPRLIQPANGGPNGQLFNLDKDLYESKDLIDDHPEIARQLKQKLMRERSSN